MKWIGQHIYDQISRFRGDVYFEAGVNFNTDTVTFTSANADDPAVIIENTTADAQAARLLFKKHRGVDAVDGDNIGEIEFWGYDDGTPSTQLYAKMYAEANDATSGEESGLFGILVANHDGGTQTGFSLTGGSQNNEIDATIGHGAASVTAIQGTLTMGSTAAMTNAGLLSVANQTGITGLGTISSGVWNGTAIASAYLDADTARLSGSQRFTGANEFAEKTTFDGDKNVTPGDGAAIHVDAHTVTDTNTSGSGTAALYTHVNIEKPRLAATNSSVTTTSAASLYIQGDVSAHTNQTITNNYALWVDDGDARFDGSISQTLGDYTLYDANNDANPTISLGSSATNRLEIEVEYDSGAQTLNEVNFTTYTGSSATNDGRFLFHVDEVQMLAISDTDVTSYGSFSATGTDTEIRATDTTTSSATQGGKLILQSDDGAVMADNHRLGVIEFKGAEDTSSTRSIGARIQAITRDAWDGSNNDADLEFYTTDGTTESKVLTLDADKLATFAGAVTATGALTGTLATATQPNIDSIGTDGDTLSILGDTLDMQNTTTNKPEIKLVNKTDDATGPFLNFWNVRTDSGIQDGEDDDVLGTIQFQGYDDGTPSGQSYAKIYSDIHDATSNEESGRLTFQVANHDGGLGSGLILTGGSVNNEIDVTVGLGANSVTTVAGDLTVTGDTNLYARSVISFQGQATMLSSGNWVTTGQNGISNHTWNKDVGVNTETNGTSTGSLAKQYGHQGVRMPYACTIENIYCAIRNAGGDRQVTVGLFCARAADDTGGSGLPVAWGTTTATAPILQIHADANNESGSYQNRPSHAEASVDVAMAAGDIFYPAIKLTGVTSSGDTDQILASFTVGIKTLIV